MKNLYKIDDELYIISNTENVNENCWIITDGKLVQVSYLLSDEVAKGNKIILTTNKLLIKDGVQAIDDEFLEWLVKNPGCETVMVGYGWIRLTETGNEGYWISIPDKQFEIQQQEPNFSNSMEKIINTITVANSMFGPSDEIKQETIKSENLAEFKPQYLEALSMQSGYPIYTTDPNDGEFEPRKGMLKRYGKQESIEQFKKK